MHPARSGFTLIELLVVIAIIAVLAVVVILVLNPAALLQQSRDATRLSDMATINSAMNLFAEDVTGVSLGTASTSYISVFDSSATSTVGDQCQGLSLPSLGSSTFQCAASSSYKSISGTGWIPVNLKLISSGAPIGVLPVDPSNQTSSGLYYSYASNGTQFEVGAVMESAKYRSQFSTSPSVNTYPGIAAQGSNLALSPLFNPTGLMGYWNFEEGSGSTALDQSGNGNNGTLSGVTYASGKVGRFAANVNGSYAGVSIPGQAAFALGSFTNVFWEDLSATGVMFADGDNLSGSGCGPGNQGWLFSNLYLMYCNASNNTVTPILYTFPSLNTWHQLAVSFVSNGLVSIYVDGQLNATGSVATINYQAAPNLQIGGQANGGNWVVGLLDDVRLYNRALSPAEIQALYNAQK